MASSVSISATQNSISDKLFEIVYLWAINYNSTEDVYVTDCTVTGFTHFDRHGCGTVTGFTNIQTIPGLVHPL